MKKELTKADVCRLLHSFHPLSRTLRDELDKKLQRRLFKAGDYLLLEGAVCDRMHFIAKGLVQCDNGLKGDAEQKKGGQGIDYFMTEGEITVSKESFYNRTRSRQSILAMEDTVTFSMTHAELERLYAKYPEFNIIGRKLTEQYHCKSNLKSDLLRIKKAVDRYKALKEARADLISRVPGKYLAGFLGITEETLSRVRWRGKRTVIPQRRNTK